MAFPFPAPLQRGLLRRRADHPRRRPRPSLVHRRAAKAGDDRVHLFLAGRHHVTVERDMRPMWLIEAGVYGREADPLLSEIQQQGMAAVVVPFRTLQKEKDIIAGGRIVAEGDCVLAYGTYPFARQIQLHRRWTPGAWCDNDNLDCRTYYSHFGKFLLNQRYTILPAVEAIRERDRLYEEFGPDDELFARPSGCDKCFTGRCVYKDDFVSALGPATYDPATLV